MFMATFDLAARRGGRGEEHFFFPFLLFVLLMGLVAFGLVMLSNRRRAAAIGAASPGAVATLQDRFARGEIDRVEYDHRRAVLDGDASVPPPPAPPTPAPTPPDADLPAPDAPDAATEGDAATDPGSHDDGRT